MHLQVVFVLFILLLVYNIYSNKSIEYFAVTSNKTQMNDANPTPGGSWNTHY